MFKKLTSLAISVIFSSGVLLVAAPTASADSISNTGPNSNNSVTNFSYSNTDVTNNNNVTITNSNTQTASTGDATVSYNTTGGNATTGNATNNNSTNTVVKINNFAPRTPTASPATNHSISKTGPDSHNSVSSYTINKVTINNLNDLLVNNINNQVAYSGNAILSHNTTGGNARTGNATNNNSTSVNVTVNNNAKPEAPKPSGGSGGHVLGEETVDSLTDVNSAPHLPNTGMPNEISPWAVITLLAIIASALYWQAAIEPKLKALK